MSFPGSQRSGPPVAPLVRGCMLALLLTFGPGASVHAQWPAVLPGARTPEMVGERGTGAELLSVEEGARRIAMDAWGPPNVSMHPPPHGAGTVLVDVAGGAVIGLAIGAVLGAAVGALVGEDCPTAEAQSCHDSLTTLDAALVGGRYGALIGAAWGLLASLSDGVGQPAGLSLRR